MQRKKVLRQGECVRESRERKRERKRNRESVNRKRKRERECVEMERGCV